MNLKRCFSMSALAVFAAVSFADGAINYGASESSGEPAKRVVVKVDGTNSANGEIPVEVIGDGDVQVQTIVLEQAEGDEPKRIVVRADVATTPARNIEAGGPWLGVQFGPVPKPLAAHLKLADGTGQMVLNVVEGSPADLAGIQQYDVIAAIDGEKAPSDIGAFLDQIRAFQPGDISVFSLTRGGTPAQVSVTIGTRPDDMASMKNKFESDVDHFAQGNVLRRGGIMRKDASGGWSFDALPDDDHAIWQAIPNIGDEKFDVLLDKVPFGLKRDITIQSQAGETLRIETAEDGQITVTKETKVGDDVQSSTATYANVAEFEKADPETFAKFHGHGAPGDMHTFMFKPFGEMKAFRFNLDDDNVDIDMDMNEIHERIQEHLDQLNLSEDALGDEIKAKIEEAFDRGDALGHHLQIFKGHAGPAAPGPHVFAFAGHVASTSIAVDPDGKVRVTVRNGEDELVQTFDSVEQLRAQKPELHAKYQKLQDAMDTAPVTQK